METGKTDITYSRLQQLAEISDIKIEEIICYHEPLVGLKKDVGLIQDSIYTINKRLDMVEDKLKNLETTKVRKWINRIFLLYVLAFIGMGITYLLKPDWFIPDTSDSLFSEYHTFFDANVVTRGAVTINDLYTEALIEHDNHNIIASQKYLTH